MKFRKKSVLVKTITLLLTATLCIGATAVGAYAGSSAEKTPWSVMGESGQPYTYIQRGYYQGDYIFEFGWNLNEKAYDTYGDKAKLKLSDLSTITVSFDQSCKSEAQNQAVLADLKQLIERLKPQYSDATPPLEKPIVVSVEYVGDHELTKLAGEYYTNDESAKFSAIFSSLDTAIQKEYCTKMIAEGKNNFLSANAPDMEPDILDFCLEKTYQEGKIALFAGMVPCLADDQKEAWAARAARDKKNNFFSVLTR